MLLSVSVLTSVGQGSAHADVTAVSGSAFGYYTSAGFSFCENTNPPSPEPPPGCLSPVETNGPEPTVTLPSTGGFETASIPSASASTGPAVFFESGPITVTTQGETGPSGYSTSSVSIIQDKAGVDPFYFSTIDSTCTSNGSATTASTTFTGAVINLGEGNAVVVPDNPAPNTEYRGTIDGVNDHFRIVLNEQVVTSDSITVNAMHMYMVGPTAYGEVIVGQAHCDVVGAEANQAPVSGDDAYSTPEGASLTIEAPGVLANDADPEGDPLTAQIYSASVGPTTPAYPAPISNYPNDGTLILNPDGSFTYTPDEGFSGFDTFTYLARDSRGGSDTATVTILVGAPPPANDDFADAQVISGPRGSVTGTNQSATEEAGEPDHAGVPGRDSIWYQWTAPEDGEVTFNTCDSRNEEDVDNNGWFNTTLGVYTGTTVGALTEVASNDEDYVEFCHDPDAPDRPQNVAGSRVTFTATAGTVYYIAVDSNMYNYPDPYGTVVLEWAMAVAPPSTTTTTTTAPTTTTTTAPTTTTTLAGGAPTSEDQCKRGGWKQFTNPVFRNQGECVSHVQANERGRR